MGVDTYAQFILDPYVVAAYCICYLMKVDKYVTNEMQFVLGKCKFEKPKTFEQFQKLENVFFNA
jgi:hypothetical protein